MQEILIVWVKETALITCWNVIVHNKVNLRDVDTSRQNVRGDKSREVLLSEVVNDLITLVTLQATDQDLRLDIARLQSLLQSFCGVPPIDEDHCHGALQCRVKLNYEVKFSILSHLHLKVLDTFQLLSLFLNTEAFKVADEASHEFEHRVCVGRRIETVLRRHVEFCKVLL